MDGRALLAVEASEETAAELGYDQFKRYASPHWLMWTRISGIDLGLYPMTQIERYGPRILVLVTSASQIYLYPDATGARWHSVVNIALIMAYCMCVISYFASCLWVAPRLRGLLLPMFEPARWVLEQSADGGLVESGSNGTLGGAGGLAIATSPMNGASASAAATAAPEQKLLPSSPSGLKRSRSNAPVVLMTWQDARALTDKAFNKSFGLFVLVCTLNANVFLHQGFNWQQLVFYALNFPTVSMTGAAWSLFLLLLHAPTLAARRLESRLESPQVGPSIAPVSPSVCGLSGIPCWLLVAAVDLARRFAPSFAHSH